MEFILIVLISFVAAFAGTVAMTLSQEIEIRITRRKISYTPAIAVFKILHLDFEKLSNTAKGVFSYLVHFGYGTIWGFPLALFYMFNFVSFIPVLIAYFFIVWIQGIVVIPLFGIAGPFWTWGRRAILTEVFHKIIYSAVTVVLFFWLI